MTNKETDKQYMWLILCYTIQLVIPDVCTKFKILNQICSEKCLTEDVHIHYIGVRNEKKENLKKKEK